MLTRRAAVAATLASPALLRANSLPSVIVIGAGAAGISAAFDVRQAGADVTILEAAPRWGGRMQRLDGFAKFPIDLGAEWIHEEPSVLQQIARRPVEVETITYQPQTYQVWSGGTLRKRNLMRNFYAEVKFKRTTWFGFFERYLWPSVESAVRLSSPVTEIDHRGSRIRVVASGRILEADKVIVTVPISILQAGEIKFTPTLPTPVTQDLTRVTFGQGFKLFMKFRERFYPDILITEPMRKFLADDWEDKIYYDAAFEKGASEHVLGLFSTREGHYPRSAMTEAELLKDVLQELDEAYDGAPSRLFLGAKARLWSQDPFIRGTYSMGFDGTYFDSVPQMLAPLASKVYFAGEALGGDDQSTVHGAALSGQRAAARVLSD